MAVYQISRIQIRRGQKTTGSGLPQLASGELAWAIDSQELFIGNGAVSEGAPAVGNTKIITEHDNFIDVIGNYQFAANNPAIQTNDNPLIPVIQSLQDVLDRVIFAENFDIHPGIGIDNTASIQRAIDQLFLNVSTAGTVDSRVELRFTTPGIYEFSSTIYLPSYVFITGAGIEKTTFSYSGTGSAFEFINDTSIADYVANNFVRSVIGSTTYINQPKYARLRDFTLKTNASDVTGILLNAVRDSMFENIEIQGNWSPLNGDVINGCGMNLVALSTLVTTQRNKFKNVKYKSLSSGVYSKFDIFNNVFVENDFTETQYGFVFGEGTDKLSNGQEYGPRKNIISNCIFDSVYKNGIIIKTGYGNKSRGNVFIDVGNDNGGSTNGLYSPIDFQTTGNSSLHDTFDRRDPTLNLANDSTYAYVSEVKGTAFYQNVEPLKIDIFQAVTPIMAFRLPLSNSTSFKVEYIYQSSVFVQTKKGQLHIVADLTNGTSQLVDEFEFTGTPGEDDRIFFSSAIENNCVVVYYKNVNTADVGVLTYTYNMLS